MGEPKYCAQGVCMNHGSCLSDSDCVNPANFIWSDKKCLGYLYCTSEGRCDRNCGEICKNGSKSVDCFANPCDTQPMCDEAASCVWTLAMGNALLCTLIKPAKYWTAALPGISMQTQARLETQPLIQKISK